LSTRSREEQAGADILGIVEEQVRMGPRVPGTPAHDRLTAILETRLRLHTDEVLLQEFPVTFQGRTISCANVLGRFRSDPDAASPTVTLLGTHYDTRPRADRDPDPGLRDRAIPGANDGGSGTAVLLHLLPWLRDARLPRDVVVAFFDAEDLGNIDGKEFSLGARWCAANPPWGREPNEVVVLDMVGGKDMVLDIDAHILRYPASRDLTSRIFQIGMKNGWSAFARDKPDRFKYIVSDHYPFVVEGIAACILIDIDYPQWHTQADRPQALSAVSLGVTEAVLSLYLSQPPA